MSSKGAIPKGPKKDAAPEVSKSESVVFRPSSSATLLKCEVVDEDEDCPVSPEMTAAKAPGLRPAQRSGRAASPSEAAARRALRAATFTAPWPLPLPSIIIARGATKHKK